MSLLTACLFGFAAHHVLSLYRQNWACSGDHPNREVMSLGMLPKIWTKGAKQQGVPSTSTAALGKPFDSQPVCRSNTGLKPSSDLKCGEEVGGFIRVQNLFRLARNLNMVMELDKNNKKRGTNILLHTINGERGATNQRPLAQIAAIPFRG